MKTEAILDLLNALDCQRDMHEVFGVDAKIREARSELEAMKTALAVKDEALRSLIETCESADVMEFGETPDRQTIRDAKTALSPQTDKVLEECEWSQEDPSGDFDDTWQTGCGNLFSFTEGGPSDNNFEFCCYCGKKLSPS